MQPSARTAVSLLISGDVQGVGFRYWTRTTANHLGLHGWVRNLEDGRVEAWVEGDAARVESLVEAAHRGPRSAVVSEVSRTAREPKGISGFTILKDAERPEP